MESKEAKPPFEDCPFIPVRDIQIGDVVYHPWNHALVHVTSLGQIPSFPPNRECRLVYRAPSATSAANNPDGRTIEELLESLRAEFRLVGKMLRDEQCNVDVEVAFREGRLRVVWLDGELSADGLPFDGIDNRTLLEAAAKLPDLIGAARCMKATPEKIEAAIQTIRKARSAS